MTVNELISACGFEAICLPDGEREIHGAYIGDLLSWVMGRAQADNAWITIMNNVNVIAVASLTDAAAVLLAENVALAREDQRAAAVKMVHALDKGNVVFVGESDRAIYVDAADRVDEADKAREIDLNVVVDLDVVELIERGNGVVNARLGAVGQLVSGARGRVGHKEVTRCVDDQDLARTGIDGHEDVHVAV